MLVQCKVVPKCPEVVIITCLPHTTEHQQEVKHCHCGVAVSRSRGVTVFRLQEIPLRSLFRYIYYIGIRTAGLFLTAAFESVTSENSQVPISHYCEWAVLPRVWERASYWDEIPFQAFYIHDTQVIQQKTAASTSSEHIHLLSYHSAGVVTSIGQLNQMEYDTNIGYDAT